MNKHIKVFILIAFMLIHSIVLVYPQAEQYRFRHLTTKQGLPSNKVNALLKDHEDFMWFGTDNGLARYDGYNFKIYQIPSDSIFTSNDQVITNLFEDNEGNFWVGTCDHGVKIFNRNNETFLSYEHNPANSNSLSSNYINTIYQDSEGIIWIGTGNGLNKYNFGTNNFKSFKIDNGSSDNPMNQVLSIFEDKTGTFWIGTEGGLFLFDRNKKVFTEFDSEKLIPDKLYRKFNCIIEDKNGVLWIGTNWGMFKYDRSSMEIKNYLPQDFIQTFPSTYESNTFLSNIFVSSIIESEVDGKHDLWITTSWGLNRFDIENESFKVIHCIQNDLQSLSTNFLKESYLDNNGLLWIGTFTSGVEVLNTRLNPFHHVVLSKAEQKYQYQANSFLLDKTETLWVGVIDGGLFQYDKDFNLIGDYTRWQLGINTFGERQHNMISCIFEDSDNTLWLGFYEWGLVIFDRELKSFRQIELQNNIDFKKPIKIENIIRDQYGILWVGTNTGLYFKNKNENTFSPAHIISHNELDKAEITNIFEDEKYNLWISTKNTGLYCLKPENRSSMQFVHYLDIQPNQDGFYGNYISTVFEDQKGTLWLGSDKGLNTFDFLNEQFKPDTIFNEDHAGHIIRMYNDGHNNLWLLSATKGLVRYQPYDDRKNKVKVFNVRNGLPFDNFNTLYNPANVFYQSNDGRLFISAGVGTEGSFFWFHPDSVMENKHIPRTVITNLNVGNKTFLLDSSIISKRHITLNYNENFFSFEFAALDYLIPEKNQYAYYLEGFENEWIYTGNQRFANYTGVPPGEYVFKVKASNNDGYWNEEGTSIHISILPPFWKTWWAYIVYVLIVIAVIYSIIHYYLKRQHLLHSLEIEHIEAEKLKELDSMKSRFFANISHEFRTPLTLIMGPLKNFINKTKNYEDKRELSVMQRNALRLQSLINQLLNLSKLEARKMNLQTNKLNIVKLVKNYIQSFESLARQRNISLTFNAEEEMIEVYVDCEKIEQVLNNLLSNAFKFTKDGGKIKVSLKPLTTFKEEYTQLFQNEVRGISGNWVEITISDTGKGILPDKLEHIFDRFYQADDSQTRHHEGTGIGLALVKEHVGLHRGHISAKSRIQEGTTFTILLPLGKDHLIPDEINESSGYETIETQVTDQLEEDPFIGLPEQERALNEEETGLPIMLIVEDNLDMRNFIGNFFKHEFRLIEAVNGKEGVDKAIDHIPDIIISDVMMPEMDGNEFCKIIKVDERTSHIPVILLTARASKESRLEGLGKGADDFITKPFDGEELQVRVKNLLNQRKKLSKYYIKEFESIQKSSKEEILSMDEKFLQKAQSIVQNKLSDPEYGVEGFAADMALSRFQLHRKLTALLNQSITEFIRIIRLNFAVDLLKKRAGTIAEIAYDSGFNNPTYFSISFKKHFGISPTEYINGLDKKENI